MDFPCSSVGQESACNAGDPGSIPILGRCPGQRNWQATSVFCLENPIYRGAWQTTVHGVTRVRHNLATKASLLRLVIAILRRSKTLGFPGGSAGEESACSAGDLGLSPGLGRFPGKGNHYPLQYSSLENSTDCIVHGVIKSRT